MNPADRTKKRLPPTETDAHQWTAEAFERLVFEGKPKVAVFDCDGTLWSGDAGYGFMAWSLEQGLVSRSTNDWVDSRYRDYLAGNVSEAAMCGEMVQMYAGLRDSELQAAAARYVSEFVRERVFAEMAALVEKMRQAGIEIWAVSSTNRWVVAEGLRDFGKRVGLPAPDAVFGNSIHDLAMLKMARCPFPVNPSPALLVATAKRGWGYFRPRVAEGVEAAVGGE
jgi:phosphoserine phosphatase